MTLLLVEQTSLELTRTNWCWLVFVRGLRDSRKTSEIIDIVNSIVYSLAAFGKDDFVAAVLFRTKSVLMIDARQCAHDKAQSNADSGVTTGETHYPEVA